MYQQYKYCHWNVSVCALQVHTRQKSISTGFTSTSYRIELCD